ncbi:nucleotide sugar dehydrogenase [Paenibacillus spongiae]|uniref:Nucleotide sugar dehydrogenase n=1 Tax=Paenibacillus spongiae TaxID=2909671 RepID=A0ABY5S4K4_9BACL|nr:nucleotide sugar dehydrogenase [Paenibacillus spongiae]UVI28639.1 nucleotide sugar dehydrogenase [Paenibacillus spongiae]
MLTRINTRLDKGSRALKICVIGLGYIGLPTAVMFAKYGLRVHGVDVNSEVVTSLIHNNPHINEPGLKEIVTDVIHRGLLTVSSEPEEANVFIIAVQTPINPDKTANLEYVKIAAENIVPFLKKGDLVILESTVPPRTVEDVLIPTLQRSKLEIGSELFIAYSPERVLPGKLFEELVTNDRIVGGINLLSSQKTADLYKHFVKGNIHITDAGTAEIVKLIENSYRDINIAFANELARIAEVIGIDIWQAIKLANSHPRVHVHNPGPGVGGHCIAVDPWFLVEKAPREAELITLARSINDSTPQRVIRMIETAVREINQPVITLLGLAFKGNIDDMRESPSLVIMNALIMKGYNVKVFDPLIKTAMEGKVTTLEEAARDSDCLVFLTDHDQFRTIDYSLIKDLLRTKMVLDMKNVTERNELTDLGITCIKIGSSQHEPQGDRSYVQKN